MLFTRSSTITFVSINSPETSASVTIAAASAADVGGWKEGGERETLKTSGHKLGTVIPVNTMSNF